MKWLPLILGGLLGVLLREIGGWAPRWAVTLVKRRARVLGEDDRVIFVEAAEKRLAEIPGDWAKLIFAAIRLRVPKTREKTDPRTWDWATLPRSAELIINVLPAAFGAFAMVISATVVLHFAWYLVVPFSIVWALLIFNLDRMIVFPPVRIGGWRNTAVRILRALPRLIVAIFLGWILADLLMLALYSPEINRYLDANSPHDRGVLSHLQALSHFRRAHPSIVVMQYALGTLVVLIDLMPSLYRTVISGNVRPDQGHHRSPDTASEPAD